MKVQIFEPFAGWHHTKYIATLLPTLTRLLKEHRLDEVVVTTSRAHLKSPHFADQLADYTSLVSFDAVEIDQHQMSSIAVADMLLMSIKKHQPDFLVSTSANNGAFPLALRSFMNGRNLSHVTQSVGILHNGYSSKRQIMKHFLKDLIQRFAREQSPWSELHVVNPLLYETIKRQGGSAARRLKLLPDPVVVRDPIGKLEARRALQIPLEGRYVGIVGEMDKRKAVPNVLAAFRRANLSDTDFLLLAGRLKPTYRELIQSRYSDLLASGRIVLLDRYLRPDELHVATSACDAIAVTYFTDELSSNLLAALAAGRPVIASRRGYTGMVIDTFEVGWSCDVRNIASLKDAMEAAFRNSSTFSLNQKAKKLLAFHDPQNFVDTVLTPLYTALEIPVSNVKSWEWATSVDA
ncbi:MAG: hypothetical protein NVS2B17_19850 [Candidatus Velthaea sp.]